MKIFNLSLKELLKNKLYFSYFALGLALILAVLCVLANYSRQVFNGFFTQFNDGQTLPLEVKEIPRESRYFEEIPIFAQKEGLTYNVTLQTSENSVFLPSYRGGICVANEGNFLPRELKIMTMFGLDLKFKTGVVYPSAELANELKCRKGDKILISGREFEVGEIIAISGANYNFFIYDPEIETDEFTLILSNKDQLLEISQYLNSENFTDSDGILALCEGFRAMKTAMNIVIALLCAVCGAYIFVFIKMYFSKRAEFLTNLQVLGIRKSRLFFLMGAVFFALTIIGGAAGLLISELLDILVDFWAREFLKMTVDEVNYPAYFAVGIAFCIAISAVSLIINIKNLSDSEVKNR